MIIYTHPDSIDDELLTRMLSLSLSLSLTHTHTHTHTQQSSLRKTMSPVTTAPTKPSYQSPKIQFQGGKSPPPVSLQKSAEDWELHPCQIVVENKLGQGGFGDVYQGTIRGGVGIYKSNGPQIMRVAVKILRGKPSCTLYTTQREILWSSIFMDS